MRTLISSRGNNSALTQRTWKRAHSGETRSFAARTNSSQPPTPPSAIPPPAPAVCPNRETCTSAILAPQCGACTSWCAIGASGRRANDKALAPSSPFALLMQTNSVGSSWMTDMLNSHPHITMEGEYPLQGSSVGQIYTAYAWKSRQGRTKRFNGPEGLANRSLISAWGFKVKLEVLQGAHRDAGLHRGHDRLPDFLVAMRCLEVRLLCLARRNWVKHAVSRVKQEAHFRYCRSWTPTHGQVNKTNCASRITNVPLKRLRIELNVTRRSLNLSKQVCVEEAAQHGVDLRVGVNQSARVRMVYYEDLAYGSRRSDEWAALQRWLGTAPAALSSSAMKMTASNLRTAISNYDEVEGLVASVYGRRSAEVAMLQEEED